MSWETKKKPRTEMNFPFLLAKKLQAIFLFVQYTIVRFSPFALIHFSTLSLHPQRFIFYGKLEFKLLYYVKVLRSYIFFLPWNLEYVCCFHYQSLSFFFYANFPRLRVIFMFWITSRAVEKQCKIFREKEKMDMVMQMVLENYLLLRNDFNFI